MKAAEKEKIRKDISEAFDFVRFVLKNPQLLSKIKDGSEIRFLPDMAGKAPRSSHMPRNVQAFTTETIFHSL